jgi:hypothetical protein
MSGVADELISQTQKLVETYQKAYSRAIQVIKDEQDSIEIKQRNRLSDERDLAVIAFMKKMCFALDLSKKE